MNRTVERKMEKSFLNALIVFGLQSAGAVTGILIVFLMALFRDDIEGGLRQALS